MKRRLLPTLLVCPAFFALFATGSYCADETAEDAQSAPVVEVDLFVSTDCPVANGYAPEINRIYEDYAHRGVKLRLVYPDPVYTDEAIARHRREYRLLPEGVRDPGHRLVKRAGATITPEAAVFDGDGKLRYRGRIDDRVADYGKKRARPGKTCLRDVLDKLLADKEFPFEEKEAVGCFIEPLPYEAGSDS